MRAARPFRSKRPGSARAMFSTTVMDSNSAKCWNTIAMPSARASPGLPMWAGWPFHSMLPASGRTAP